ncbi:DNA polymerase III subunit chi [Alkalicaulis satelles]|uniref:DNA polymerase III subunit chi n=1 Tax=Alkalicaulis satelles TaxID=2609175 RepID=A0A5M6ZMK4_9PROT|nr:DNA polymerase III subunit chi [Alkalicaulis satelles]KAA5805145.1 DNA polymerase III subunit chi [Alkalicaulis satelles]
MSEIWFYHHESARIEQTLPALLMKVLERGGRALVISPLESRIESLDQHLWTFTDDSFLPHGRADRPRADQQPVLLAREPENINNATMLFCLDGADPGDGGGWDRVLVMFEADDPGALNAARALWSARKKSQTPVSYYKQSSSGRWEKSG